MGRRGTRRRHFTGEGFLIWFTLRLFRLFSGELVDRFLFRLRGRNYGRSKILILSLGWVNNIIGAGKGGEIK